MPPYLFSELSLAHGFLLDCPAPQAHQGIGEDLPKLVPDMALIWGFSGFMGGFQGRSS